MLAYKSARARERERDKVRTREREKERERERERERDLISLSRETASLVLSLSPFLCRDSLRPSLSYRDYQGQERHRGRPYRRMPPAEPSLSLLAAWRPSLSVAASAEAGACLWDGCQRRPRARHAPGGLSRPAAAAIPRRNQSVGSLDWNAREWRLNAGLPRKWLARTSDLPFRDNVLSHSKPHSLHSSLARLKIP